MLNKYFSHDKTNKLLHPIQKIEFYIICNNSFSYI